MFKRNFMFIPLASRNIAIRDNGLLGYTDWYIFGIRIVRIQKTIPWA
jgi:hypothetical protein